MSKFEEMKFRQHGHEEEMPMDFLQRRTRYNAFLYPDQEDGTAVVDRILRTVPTVWLGDINSERYPNLFSLFAATRRHCATLMASWNTAVQLRTLGNYYTRRSKSRHAHAVDLDPVDKTAEEADPASEVEERDAHVGFRGSRRPKSEGNGRANPPSTKMRWPEGKTVKGYAFSKRDEVHSDRKPPGNCFVCTSGNHFARDYPHYGAWEAMRDANMLDVSVSYEDDEADRVEYLAMIADRLNTTESVYSSETSETNVRREVLLVSKSKTDAAAAHLVRENHRNGRRRLRFEAVAQAKVKEGKGKGKGNEEYSGFLTTRHFRRWQQFRQKPDIRIEGKGPPTGENLPSEEREELATTDAGASSLDPSGEQIVKASRAKSHPPGFGSLGVRALHMKVSVGSPDAVAIKGRLDSGADITLISEEYYLSLGYLPKPREGLRMRLYALTGEAKVLGFTKFTMYARAIDGALISFEVEAYVVRNMRVPLLLGEDFQMAYELGTTRYSSGHCEIRVGQTDHIIPASSAEAVDLGFEVRQVHAV
jgi:hypothetical protein